MAKALDAFVLPEEKKALATLMHIPARTALRFQALRGTKKVLKRIVPLALALYFAPRILAFYLCCGLVDVLRNRNCTLATLNRYFTGNGFFTWLLAPFNLLMDILTLPFRNKGIYSLTDLPPAYQDEINAIIAVAHRRNIIGQLETKMHGQKRGMIFFKWYGKNVGTSLDIPEYHQPFKHIRTIGVSIFNKQQSTGEHFGPLRVTLRVLYNINTIDDTNVYIRVGNRTHYWRENKLFIFDDTLEHQSCNKSDSIRYCLFLDILRPSLLSGVISAVLAGIRLAMAHYSAFFYQHWAFIK